MTSVEESYITLLEEGCNDNDFYMLVILLRSWKIVKITGKMSVFRMFDVYRHWGWDVCSCSTKFSPYLVVICFVFPPTHPTINVITIRPMDNLIVTEIICRSLLLSPSSLPIPFFPLFSHSLFLLFFHSISSILHTVRMSLQIPHHYKFCVSHEWSAGLLLSIFPLSVFCLSFR